MNPRMEFFTYRKIHFTNIVEIRILICIGLLMDMVMYSIGTYTDIVKIRYDNFIDIRFTTFISKEA
jgi:hypothetical protein